MPTETILSTPSTSPDDTSKIIFFSGPDGHASEDGAYARASSETGSSSGAGAGADDDGHGHPANDDPNL